MYFLWGVVREAVGLDLFDGVHVFPRRLATLVFRKRV
jgi:hypothetical protein